MHPLLAAQCQRDLPPGVYPVLPAGNGRAKIMQHFQDYLAASSLRRGPFDEDAVASDPHALVKKLQAQELTLVCVRCGEDGQPARAGANGWLRMSLCRECIDAGLAGDAVYTYRWDEHE
uniref:Uncharacterized protein n=1 Tax=Mycena chlorophos TaxID=658473 RepID=A0ABQ0L6X1_MYCCL|nr:predicted protein [Mycena chlorophos]